MHFNKIASNNGDLLKQYQTIYTDDYEVRFAVYTRGDLSRHNTPPIILLHGYMTWSNTWEQVLNILPGDYPIICIDLPGHGAASKVINLNRNMRQTITADTIANLLEALFSAMCISQCYLVGTQMGGSISSFYLSRYQSRVISAIIMAAGALGESKKNMTLFRLLSRPKFGHCLARCMGFHRFSQKWLAAHGPIYRHSHNKQFNQTRGTVGHSVDLQNAYEYFKSHAVSMSESALQIRKSYGPYFDALVPRLSNCSVPVTLLWGDCDTVVPPAVGKRYHHLLKNSLLHLLPGVGDFPQHEAPATVAEHICQMISASSKETIRNAV